MKKNLILAATIAITALLIGSNSEVFGKTRKFKTPDGKCTLQMQFYNTDSILVITPNDYAMTETDRNDIKCHVCFERVQNKPTYIYKTESEVTKSDLKKHILLYGLYKNFKRNEFLKIPIKKHANGFEFHSRVYDNKNDAFFYINKKANRMYVCKNSSQARHDFFSVGGSAYPLHIFSGHEIVITGIYL